MKSRKRLKTPPILLIILGSIVIIVILSLVLVFGILFREYSKWSQGFEASMKSEKIVTLPNDTLKTEIDKKIEIFGKSVKKIDFIELKETEFMYLLAESLNTSLPVGVVFNRGYIDTEKGLWNIYIQTELKGLKLPWIVLKLQKDNTESAQVYVRRMSVGNFDFTDYGANFIIERINKGISESLLLVNESEFTGRTFRNIELESEKITIKGEK